MKGRSRRTQECGLADAKVRLSHAEKFLEVAELVSLEDVDESQSVAAALGVLAGIAASDAICCARLARRSRGEDHREAESFLAQIEPNGRELASALRRLIDLKDTAQYGLIHLGRQRLASALRQARVLVRAAADAIRG